MSDELPMGWLITTLDKLLTTFESGSRPRGGVRGIAEGIPSIGGEHLNYNGGFNFDSIKYVPQVFAARMTKGRICHHDILVVKDGATTGKTAFVDSHFPFDDAVVNEHVFICRPTLEIEPRFLFRFLLSMEGQARILENFKGSAQGGINQTFAPNTEVPLAPLPEQLRIVAKLEKLLGQVDACQQRLAKIPALLKRFRQSVLAAACSGRLTADWREEDTFVASRSGSTQDDAPDVPESWTWKLLSDIAQVKGGVTKGRKLTGKKTIVLPYLRVANVQDGYLDLSEMKDIEVLPEDKERYHLEIGDILFTEGGDRDKLGRGTLWRGEIPDCIHQNHIFRARLYSKDVNPEYVSVVSKSVFSRSYFFENASQTVNLASINLTMLSALPLPLPPLLEQHEIVRRVDALFALADQIETRVAKAQAQVDKLTQSILAKAFRGELVPQDPNDEPVSVLLERIRSRQSSAKRVRRRRGRKKSN